jgi:hypothetical protein
MTLAMKMTVSFKCERKNAMTDMPKYSGLCETCDHDATCMLRRSTQLEIIQCEEFSTKPVAGNPVPPASQKEPADPKEAARLGLCANCLNVLTCGFPNARQGVLHCEEYVLDEAGVVPPMEAEYSQSAA